MDFFAFKDKYASEKPNQKIDFIKDSAISLTTVNQMFPSLSQGKMLIYVYKIHTSH